MHASAAPDQEVSSQEASEEAGSQEASEEASSQEALEEVTTQELSASGKFPDDYKVVFATPTDAGTPTSQLDIQLVDLYQVLVSILACLIAIITWGVFKTVYRVLTSQKI